MGDGTRCGACCRFENWDEFMFVIIVTAAVSVAATERRREGRGERQQQRAQPRTDGRSRRMERPSEPRPRSSRHSNAGEGHTARQKADQGRAVGFSDHVPAFLLRPVRIPISPRGAGRGLSLSAPDFEAESNNRGRVPEHPEIIAGWGRNAAAYRARAIAPRRARHSVWPACTPSDRRVSPRWGGRKSAAPHRSPRRLLALSRHLSCSATGRGANARGYPGAVVEYRLCPEVAVTEIIEDVRAAVLFLHRRFGKRLAVCGHSAGGDLAASLAATEWRAYGADVPGAPHSPRHGDLRRLRPRANYGDVDERRPSPGR